MIQKNSIKVEVQYDDSNSKRYYLSVEWNKEKPCALVIMLSPSRSLYGNMRSTRAATLPLQNITEMPPLLPYLKQLTCELKYFTDVFQRLRKTSCLPEVSGRRD